MKRYYGRAMPSDLSPLFVNPLPLFVTPSLSLCHPEPPFCHPERSEGSLGACALCEDRVRRFLASLETTRWRAGQGGEGMDKAEGYDRVGSLDFFFFPII
jgi:hypothetical protein